jgi:hypothetical protein
VIHVQVGHHHDRQLRGLDSAPAELGRDVLFGRQLGLADAGRDGAEVLARIGCDRGMQAGVDEDRAGAGVADQEGRAGHAVVGSGQQRPH